MIRLPLPALAALSIGCASDEIIPNHIDDVRVIAIRSDPPEFAPGLDHLDIDVWVADPRSHGVELVIWSCTDLGYGCAEAWRTVGGGRPLSAFARVERPTTGHVGFRWTPLGLDEEQLPAEVERTDAAALLWALACAPGRCELFDRVLADPAPGSRAWREAVRMLSDPRAALAGVAVEHANLAVKTVPIRDRTGDLENSNPQVDLQRGDLVAPRQKGLPQELDLTVTEFDGDEWTPHVYTTLGSVEEISHDTATAELTLAWTPLWTEGVGGLWVVADDGRGGVGVWTGTVQVRPR